MRRSHIEGIAQNYIVPLPLSWLVAAVGGAIFSALFGNIMLGLRSHYFAIGTSAVVKIMRDFANYWQSLTGDAIGMNMPIMDGTPAMSTSSIWLCGALPA